MYCVGGSWYDSYGLLMVKPLPAQSVAYGPVLEPKTKHEVQLVNQKLMVQLVKQEASSSSKPVKQEASSSSKQLVHNIQQQLHTSSKAAPPRKSKALASSDADK